MGRVSWRVRRKAVRINVPMLVLMADDLDIYLDCLLRVSQSLQSATPDSDRALPGRGRR